MKLLFWVLLGVSAAITVAGVAICMSSPTSDPGTRGAPTLFGIGVMVTAGGASLAATVLGLAVWWVGIALTRARLLRERPADEVLVMQAAKSVRELSRQTGAPWPFSTYVICIVSDAALEIWSSRRLLVRVPAASIGEISVGTVVTSRSVPSLHFSSEMGAFDLVPGRPGWELFPNFNRSQVAEVGERILVRWRAIDHKPS